MVSTWGTLKTKMNKIFWSDKTRFELCDLSYLEKTRHVTLNLVVPLEISHLHSGSLELGQRNHQVLGHLSCQGSSASDCSLWQGCVLPVMQETLDYRSSLILWLFFPTLCAGFFSGSWFILEMPHNLLLHHILKMYIRIQRRITTWITLTLFLIISLLNLLLCCVFTSCHCATPSKQYEFSANSSFVELSNFSVIGSAVFWSYETSGGTDWHIY